MITPWGWQWHWGMEGLGKRSQLTWSGCGSKAPAGWAEWVFVGCILAGFPAKATEETSPSSSASRPKHASTGRRRLLRNKRGRKRDRMRGSLWNGRPHPRTGGAQSWYTWKSRGCWWVLVWMLPRPQKQLDSGQGLPTNLKCSSYSVFLVLQTWRTAGGNF